MDQGICGFPSKLSHDNKISFDAASCLGCLSCTAVCPTGAMRPKRQTDTALLSAAADVLGATPGQVVFACDQLTAAAKGAFDERYLVKVKCVASVDVTALVHLASRGAETLVLACGDCAACPLGEKCPGTASRAAETANLLLATWNSPARVKVTSKTARQHPPHRGSGLRPHAPRLLLRRACGGP